MIDLTKEIWQTMRTNKLRTFLTGFSVAWGIFMLILLLAIANGVVKQTTDFAASNDPLRLQLWRGWTGKPYKGLPEGRMILFHERHFDAIAAASPEHIASVSATKTLSGQIAYGANSLTRSSATGAYPEYFKQRFRMLYGRSINDADVSNTRKMIMLSTKDAATLFGIDSLALGKQVKVGQYTFTVVGVYDHDWQTDPFIPFSTCVALTGYNDETYNLNVHMKDIENTEQSQEVGKKVVRRLADLEKFDPDDASAVYWFDRFQGAENDRTAGDILNYVMWVIGILTLLTGIVGVSNIMFVSVKERTHEIGIRRAIGAKPRKIIGQVILESVALTTCFGYIGIVMGTIATEIIKKAFEGTDFDMLQPQVDMGIALQVTLALVIAGALAGLFPALRAMKVNPVEALRDE